MSLTLILGCMFAGKTSELMRLYRRAQHADQRCLMVKPGNDNRYSESEVVSHDQHRISAYVCRQSKDVLTLLTPGPQFSESLGESLGDARFGYDYLFFDEGQFFDDLPETCETLLNLGKRVYVAALRSDFRRHPFPTVSRLVALANGGILSLTAVCKCGQDATESKLIAKVQLTDEQTEYIGGDESYHPTCRQCYFK